ncbi:cold-shock protein [Vibrio ziniensis]|uniref:Cold shock domain-containing protein n=1 Tax=Vibrio ziniensis TaxID=2711221 RepID=A0A6G7CHG6_9VIBR|nr:cold shock domain-containing protein [Vibrio ziniensis]QIH41520.1 cold shock domain-containing protein [Vibrio ziniensis]
MKGKLVSYVHDKKYGFVKGEDGESYFFHASSLIDKTNESKLVKGVIVEFDPVPTPKGLSAKRASIPDVLFSLNLVDFFITKSSKPKYGDVVHQSTIATKFFKDLDEAKAHLKDLAEKVGANAVLNLKHEKDTFSNGNYKYTVHAFTADLAIVTEKVPCTFEGEARNSLDWIKSRRTLFSRTFDELVRVESEARARQLNKGCALFMISIIAIPAFLTSIYHFIGERIV